MRPMPRSPLAEAFGHLADAFVSELASNRIALEAREITIEQFTENARAIWRRIIAAGCKAAVEARLEAATPEGRRAQAEAAMEARGEDESAEALRHRERHDPATCLDPKPCAACLRSVQFTPGYKGMR